MGSEQALIKGCQEGNRKDQRRLYELFAGRMLAISQRYSKSDLEAEDILQESFIKVFKNISSFRGDSSLYYWIKRIVVNTALNHQRSKLYMYPMSDVSTMSIEVDEQFTLANYHYQELMEIIRDLPPGCQIIFNLYAIEGYPHKEIAKMLEISEGTSKSQYARARSLLQEKIRNEKKMSYGRTSG